MSLEVAKIETYVPQDLGPFMDQSRQAIGMVARTLLDRIQSRPANTAAPRLDAVLHVSDHLLLRHTTRRHIRFLAPHTDINDLGALPVIDKYPGVRVAAAHTMTDQRYAGLHISERQLRLGRQRGSERWVGIVAIKPGEKGPEQKVMQISNRGNLDSEEAGADMWSKALEGRETGEGVSAEQRLGIAESFGRGLAEADLVARSLRELHGIRSDFMVFESLQATWHAVADQARNILIGEQIQSLELAG